MRQAWPHSLEIDEARLVILDDNVLALEIAMHEAPRALRQRLGDFFETDVVAALPDFIRVESEVPDEAVFEKVILFPAIQSRVEARLKRARLRRGRLVRAQVQRELSFCQRKKRVRSSFGECRLASVNSSVLGSLPALALRTMF